MDKLEEKGDEPMAVPIDTDEESEFETAGEADKKRKVKKKKKNRFGRPVTIQRNIRSRSCRASPLVLMGSELGKQPIQAHASQFYLQT